MKNPFNWLATSGSSAPGQLAAAGSAALGQVNQHPQGLQSGASLQQLAQQNTMLGSLQQYHQNTISVNPNAYKPGYLMTHKGKWLSIEEVVDLHRKKLIKDLLQE